MNTSKIKTIGEISDFNTDNGKLYSFPITFENDEHGLAFKKAADSLYVGYEMTYDLIPTTSRAGKTYLKIKEIKEDKWDGGGKKKGRNDAEMNRSVSASYAKDILVARIRMGLDDGSIKDMLSMADEIFNWLEQKPTQEYTGETDTEFSGHSMNDVPKVVYGSSPDVEDTRPDNRTAAGRNEPQNGDMITPKQLNLIRNVEKYENKDVEAICHEEMGCAVEGLTKAQASEFIDILKK